MSRTPFLAANWKMNKTVVEARAFAEAFLPRVDGLAGVEIAIAPPATALHALGEALAGTAVALAAQNVHPEPSGAFTGELSTGMLAEVGCRYAIVGHSERRTLFGEGDADVAAKARALLAAGLRPIVCLGESLEEREADRTLAVCEAQLEGSLAGIEAGRAGDLVLAYEPIWAIGTGRTATPEIAQEVHGFIRGWLEGRFGRAGQAVRIQYGGSMKPENAAELLAQPDIDGGLVGGASLDPESFASLCRSAAGPA
ncbi:MAG TPA: triose-phosphate isomerase [Myxococcota bacterium]|nr:triose-phosphate isomerase [Myxococcota bacterium]